VLLVSYRIVLHSKPMGTRRPDCPRDSAERARTVEGALEREATIVAIDAEVLPFLLGPGSAVL
jgi:hypothetical protein